MSGAYDYYCMDLASLMPVIALDLQLHETVLDMCAGPGGKSLAILQTLLPSKLICNDISGKRLQRAQWVMDMYTEGVGQDIKDTFEFRKMDGTVLPVHFPNAFDKVTNNLLSLANHQVRFVFIQVLCDAPCLSDKFVVREATESNLFSGRRKKERLLLPQRQIELLV